VETATELQGAYGGHSLGQDDLLLLLQHNAEASKAAMDTQEATFQRRQELLEASKAALERQIAQAAEKHSAQLAAVEARRLAAVEMSEAAAQAAKDDLVMREIGLMEELQEEADNAAQLAEEVGELNAELQCQKSSLHAAELANEEQARTSRRTLGMAALGNVFQMAEARQTWRAMAHWRRNVEQDFAFAALQDAEEMWEQERQSLRATQKELQDELQHSEAEVERLQGEVEHSEVMEVELEASQAANELLREELQQQHYERRAHEVAAVALQATLEAAMEATMDDAEAAHQAAEDELRRATQMSLGMRALAEQLSRRQNVLTCQLTLQWRRSVEVEKHKSANEIMILERDSLLKVIERMQIDLQYLDDTKAQLRNAKAVAKETDELVKFLQQREEARVKAGASSESSVTGLHLRQRMFGKKPP